jgi:flavin reductase (DIM6/NTAB) family NADH-FMN oxidoreductase RutF
MECELLHSYDIINDNKERTGTVVLGRVRYFHINDKIVDKETFMIDTKELKPVSRLGGITYSRTTDSYELPVRTVSLYLGQVHPETDRTLDLRLLLFYGN